MKLLKQPTDYSCGHTCVAMIANVKPEKVIDIVNSDKRKAKSWRGTSSRQLVRALRILGWRTRKKCCRVRLDSAFSDGKTYSSYIPKLCIAKLTITGKRWGHWVVHNKGVIYDPYYGLNPDWNQGIHMTSYLEILGKRKK